MTNTKYTTLEQSQRLKEIGFEAEADGYWAIALKDCIDDGKEKKRYFVTDDYDGDYRLHIPAYRLDTLLGHVKYPAHELQTALCRLDIVAAIAAAVDLLVLLKEVEDNA